MDNSAISAKLDWNQLLGFEQVAADRAKLRGTRIGSKVGNKLGDKIGVKLGGKIGSKAGIKR